MSRQSRSENEDYPTWTCKECAVSQAGDVTMPQLATFHMDICDVCNEWRQVTQPRDYGYPALKTKRDKLKIYENLMEVMNECIRKKEYGYAIQITKEIEEIIREMLEKGNEKVG